MTTRDNVSLSYADRSRVVVREAEWLLSSWPGRAHDVRLGRAGQGPDL
jgi:hypothetical protein